MGLSANTGEMVLQLCVGLGHRILSQHLHDDRNDLLSETRFGDLVSFPLFLGGSGIGGSSSIPESSVLCGARGHYCYGGVLRKLAERAPPGFAVERRGCSSVQGRDRGTTQAQCQWGNGPGEAVRVLRSDAGHYRDTRGHAPLGWRISC